LEALNGLTLNQARQAVASVLVDGALSVSDAEQLMERKVREIVDTICGGSPEALVAALLDWRPRASPSRACSR
ncbi:MAG TPA: hypothetical protein PKK15_21945, partial [Kouleothrix sp.]|nr:hypothetical protein [Kouleothrix sp.]